MKIKAVMIILSDICNAECTVCHASCSPRGTNKISEDLMIKIIGEASDCGAARIAFSGGEPFMHYGLLKKGLEYSKELNLKTEVHTNGFWGGWTDGELSDKIKKLPIDGVEISTDAYHQKYVPESYINRAVSFAKKNRISLVLKIGEMKTGESVSECFDKLDNYKYLTEVIFYPFIRAGRAAGFPESDFYRLTGTEDMQCVEEDTVTVRYDGEVFPCAGFITSDTVVSIGNIKERPLSEIIDKNSV